MSGKLIAKEEVVRVPQEDRAGPIIRWAGSKRKLLRTLAGFVPSIYNRYIEPFAGSACLFFYLNPPRAILNDLNPELIAFYRCVRKETNTIYERATSRVRSTEEYRSIRSAVPKDSVDRAVRFFYLNRLCFNGLYRTNKQGLFNVPMGNKTGNFPSFEQFREAAKSLRRVKLYNKDFEDVISLVKKDDFVYLDPPYYSPEGRWRNEYGNNCFTTEDLPRLVNALKKIDAAGATFLLSYSDDNVSLLEQLRSYSINRITVRRHISGFISQRTNAREIIVTNRDLD